MHLTYINFTHLQIASTLSIFPFAGLDPDDMGKAVLLQKALLEAGASPERIAEAMKGSLVRSGMSLEHMLTMMAIGLKST